MSEETVQTQPRVLLVDDSRMVRATICKHIRGKFDVREEADGEAGWQTLMLDPSIEVVISDLTMPKLDGYGMLMRIRASSIARIRDVPVIMISGDEDEAARTRAKECGATDFITKGIGTVELLSRLEALVRLAQASRELEASREAMAGNAMVDPESGLPTGEYLKQQGRQALSLAQRHGGEISVVVIEVEHYDDLVARHGRAVGEQLIKQFRDVLSNRVRQEDTVSQTGAKQFTVVCPGSSIDEAKSFAARLQHTIGRASVRYRGEQLTIGLRFGFANSRDDTWQSVTSLLDLAQGRTDQAEGVAAAVASSGATPAVEPETAVRAEEAQVARESRPEPAPAVPEVAESPLETAEEPAAQAEAVTEVIEAIEAIEAVEAVEAVEPAAGATGLSVEQALQRLAEGDEDGVKPHVVKLMEQLTPLLKVIDRELRLGMHVNEAQAKLQRIYHPDS